MPYQYKSNLKVENEVQLPKMFTIIMHNDDYTSMDFVVQVLKKIFHKNEIDADNIMLEVHKSGKSVVGIYTYDVAVTKKMQTDQMSKEKGFPLKLTIDEAIE